MLRLRRVNKILFSLVETSQIHSLSNIVNTANFANSVGRPKAKNLSASRVLRPLIPDQALCPETPLGALPPDSHYSLALPRSP